jgi:hypothetical protein
MIAGRGAADRAAYRGVEVLDEDFDGACLLDVVGDDLHIIELAPIVVETGAERLIPHYWRYTQGEQKIPALSDAEERRYKARTGIEPPSYVRPIRRPVPEPEVKAPPPKPEPPPRLTAADILEEVWADPDHIRLADLELTLMRLRDSMDISAISHVGLKGEARVRSAACMDQIDRMMRKTMLAIAGVKAARR